LAGVLVDHAGHVYGAVGAIFELIQTRNEWKKIVLACCSVGALISDKAGNIYGTGFNSKGCCGNVFRLTYANGRWHPNVLYTFEGGSRDGDSPQGLALDDAGNLLGSTYQGGGTGCGRAGCGTVFKLTRGKSGWKEALLYRFTGGGDGATPASNGAVVVDQVDNVYGATFVGGNPGCSQGGCGVVFKIAP
jgi:hypothetical protein